MQIDNSLVQFQLDYIELLIGIIASNTPYNLRKIATLRITFSWIFVSKC
jgi:hypothetical protein